MQARITQVINIINASGAKRRAAGALILCSSTGRFLLQKRSNNVNNPGVWSTIGGKVEPGESDVQAMQRELLEETGYNGPMSISSNLHVFKHGEFQYTTFLVTVRREFIPVDSLESDGHSWFYPDEFPKKLHQGFAALLTNVDIRTLS